MTLPEAQRTRPAMLTVVALAMLALIPLAVMRRAVRPIDDPDAYWHILSGQNVWRTHRVVVDDPFGAFSTNRWVQIDWLSDVVMAGAHHAGGFAAVSWLYAALSVALFLAMYLACRVTSAPPTAVMAAVVGWMGTYASQGFRPQTVSFVLLAITMLAWERFRARGTGPPWWLVPLSYLWACLHGLWILGPLVGFAVVIGIALDRTRTPRQLAGLVAVPVASVLVAAATPVGPQLLLMPFTVNSYAGLVSEWRPPDVHEPYVAMTVGLLVVVAVAWARSTRRASSPEVLLWLMALGWTLLYSRTVAVGAVIAAPLAARALGELIVLQPDPAGRRPERWVVALSAGAALVVGALVAPSVAVGTSGTPTSLDAAIARLPSGTVILNDDALGGWLLLEHPDVRPVIDTRTYLFDVPYIKSYVNARDARGDWPAFVQEVGASAALLREGEPLASALTRTPGWGVSASGDGFVLITTSARSE